MIRLGCVAILLLGASIAAATQDLARTVAPCATQDLRHFVRSSDQLGMQAKRYDENAYQQGGPIEFHATAQGQLPSQCAAALRNVPLPDVRKALYARLAPQVSEQCGPAELQQLYFLGDFERLQYGARRTTGGR